MTLWIDDREPLGQKMAGGGNREDIRKYLKKLEVPFDVDRHDVADYFFWDSNQEPVLITRKAGDLLTSVFDGHLQDEIERCINFIKSFGGEGKLFWLLEGVWSHASFDGGIGYFKRSGAEWFRRVQDSGADPYLLPGLQVSAQTAGLHFISTGDLYDTALMLKQIYTRGMNDWPTKLITRLPRPKLKWGGDSRIARLMAIWPSLNETTATNLLLRYATIWDVLEAVRSDPKEFSKENKGIGAKGVLNIQEVLDGSRTSDE